MMDYLICCVYASQSSGLSEKIFKLSVLEAQSAARQTVPADKFERQVLLSVWQEKFQGHAPAIFGDSKHRETAWH